MRKFIEMPGRTVPDRETMPSVHTVTTSWTACCVPVRPIRHCRCVACRPDKPPPRTGIRAGVESVKLANRWPAHGGRDFPHHLAGNSADWRWSHGGPIVPTGAKHV